MFAILPSLAIAMVTAGSRHTGANLLTSMRGLVPSPGIGIANARYRGKNAVELTLETDPKFGLLGAVIPGSDFKDGTIEFDEAGLLTKNASPSARSFVGLAFHISGDSDKYECFYLRMTNGRSPNQELRNHAVQYCAHPDYLWDLLRKKRPFRYEAYTDLELGAWIHVKIVVHGTEAKFYVGRPMQPTLLVHGLLHGESHGNLALWIGGYTRGYYANLRVRSA